MASSFAPSSSYSEPPNTSQQFLYKNLLINSFIKLYLTLGYGLTWVEEYDLLEIMRMVIFKDIYELFDCIISSYNHERSEISIKVKD